MAPDPPHAARSEAVRGANDRICASATRLKFEDDQRVPFVCECGESTCLATVMMTLAAYEAVRAHERRFVLFTGHENLDHERLCEGRGDSRSYVVVERFAEFETPRI